MVISFVSPIAQVFAEEQSAEPMYICSKEEHTHTDECYEGIPHHICGNENHEHLETCVEWGYNLICDKEEHTHTEDCLNRNGVRLIDVSDAEVPLSDEVNKEDEVITPEESITAQSNVVVPDGVTPYINNKIVVPFHANFLFYPGFTFVNHTYSVFLRVDLDATDSTNSYTDFFGYSVPNNSFIWNEERNHKSIDVSKALGKANVGEYTGTIESGNKDDFGKDVAYIVNPLKYNFTINLTKPGMAYTDPETNKEVQISDAEYTITFSLPDSTKVADQTGEVSIPIMRKLDDVDWNRRNDTDSVGYIRTYSQNIDLANKKADYLISKMSLEEKLGQCLLIHYPGDGSGTVTQAKSVIDTYHPGGLIVFADMFTNSNPSSVRSKIATTQSYSDIPLIMSVDEEGGRVCRISNLPAFRSEAYKNPATLRSEGGIDLVKSDTVDKVAFLKDLGLNVNHAPVADIASTGYISDRTWGGDALGVSEYTKAVSESMLDSGVGGTLKHFPGYGNSSANTHNGFAANTLTKNDFMAEELLPFYTGMYANPYIGVMVTHNTIMAYDENNPASLSPAIYSLLRDEIGFNGLAVTDDLGMNAITNFVGGKGKECLAALKAGADMCITSNPSGNWPVMLNAVRSGELSESDINTKAKRVLVYKLENEIINKNTDSYPIINKFSVGRTNKFGDYGAYGGSVSVEEEIYLNGESHSGCTAIPEEGWVFDHWEDSKGNTVSTDATLVPTSSEDGEYKAIFKNNSNIIRYVAKSEDFDGNIQEEVLSEETVIGNNKANGWSAAITSGLYTDDVFVGWEYNGSITYENLIVPDLSKENTNNIYTYYAKYLPSTIRVNYIAGEGGSVSSNYEEVSRTNLTESIGSTISVNEGYKFVNWSSDNVSYIGETISPYILATKCSIVDGKIVSNENIDESIENQEIVDILKFCKSLTFTANFKSVKCVLSYKTQGGSLPKISSNSEDILPGKKAIGSSVIEDSNNVFLGWYSNVYKDKESGEWVKGSTSKLVSTDLEFKPEEPSWGWEDITYIAKFRSAMSKFFFTTTTGGRVSCSEMTVPFKGNGEYVSAIPLKGYTFIGWFRDGKLISTNQNYLPRWVEDLDPNGFPENVTLEARFDKSGMALTYKATAGGEISKSYEIIQESTLKSEGVLASPSSGYIFVGWMNSANRIISRNPFLQVEKPFEGWQSVTYTAVFSSVTSSSITTQYYAYIDESVINDPSYERIVSGNNKNTIHSINTQGNRLPQNGTGIGTSPNANELRTRYILEDGTLARRRVLIPMYHYQEVNLTADVFSDAIDSFNNTNYKVKEIWVLNEGADAGSVNSDDFTIIPYVDDLVFVHADGSLITRGSEAESDTPVYRPTENEYDSDNHILYLKDSATVRYVADYELTSTDLACTFYDYDISDGKVYNTYANAVAQKDGKDISEQDSNYKVMYTFKQGINNPDNYHKKNSTDVELAFGNNNIGSGWGQNKWNSPDGASNLLNQANRNALGANHGYRLRTFGLVNGLKNGVLQFSDGVCAPTLFNGGDAIGKEVFTDYSLHFEGMGNNYTMTAVNGTPLTNLDHLTNTTDKVSGVTYYHIWSNDFWPSDSFSTYGANNHDRKFGARGGNGKYAGANSTTGNLHGSNQDVPISDDGTDHNAYFGMQFVFKIKLDARYIGPMNYYFYGDDDMWIFLDDKLVGDIGGVGQSCGTYIDFWDCLDKEQEKIHIHDASCYDEDGIAQCGYTESKEYTVSVFYTERGASGSTCYMSFNVPSFVSVPVQFYGSLSLDKNIVLTDGNDSDIEKIKDEKFPVIIDFYDQKGEKFEEGINFTGTQQGTYHSGEELYISHSDSILFESIPRYTKYQVREVDPGGFTPTYTNEKGEIDWNSTSEVIITNTGSKNSEIPKINLPIMPETGGDGSNTIMFIICWSISLFCGLLIILLNKNALFKVFHILK